MVDTTTAARLNASQGALESKCDHVTAFSEAVAKEKVAASRGPADSPSDDRPGSVAGRIGEKAWKGLNEGVGSNWFVLNGQDEQLRRDQGLYNDFGRNWSTSDYLLAAPRVAFEGADKLSRAAFETVIATPLRLVNGAYHAGANVVGQSLAETGAISENEGEQLTMLTPPVS